MLNRDGISKVSLGAPTQILGDVNFQSSVGIIIGADVTSQTIDGRKIVKAGTPVHVDPANLQTPAVNPAAATTGDKPTPEVKANAVVLHDVDITGGAANGTGLVMGIVNYNRLDSETKKLVNPGDAVSGVFYIAL